jgi:steroid delta-isomerase-like uncharacterized protein
MSESIAELKGLATRFQEAVNRHDLDAAFALIDEALIDHAQPFGVVTSSSGMRAQYESWVRAFPDLNLHLEAISAEGDWVVLHAIMSGTHTGEAYLNVPTGGRSFRTYALEAFRVAHGRVAERHQWFDIFAVVRQLSATGPEPIMGTRAGEQPSTSGAEQKRTRIRQYFDEMVIPRNIDAMPKFLGENVLDHSAAPGMPAGVEGARMFLNMNYASFPWTNYDIQHVIVDGDLVTVIFQIEGEHTGAPFFGTPASGKRFKVQCIEIQRIPGEHFLEHWGGMDFYQLSSQLGLGLFGDRADQQQAQREAEMHRLITDYIEGMNDADIDRVMSVFAPTFIDHQVAPGGAAFGNDWAAVRQAHVMLHESFPNVRFAVRDVVIEGDTAFLMVRGEGTHTGAFFGIPPTGKRIRWTGTRVLRFANGKFAEGTSELDQVGILQQMGIIPGTPAMYDIAGNKRVVRGLIAAINEGNPDAYAMHMAPDVLTWIDSAEEPVRGINMLDAELGALRRAFHDLHIEIETLAAQQDKVSARVRYSGTHAGSYAGVKGTGQQYVWSGALTYRIADGKIVEGWTNMDRFTLLMQVGIIPRFGG